MSVVQFCLILKSVLSRYVDLAFPVSTKPRCVVEAGVQADYLADAPGKLLMGADFLRGCIAYRLF